MTSYEVLFQQMEEALERFNKMDPVSQHQLLPHLMDLRDEAVKLRDALARHARQKADDEAERAYWYGE